MQQLVDVGVNVVGVNEAIGATKVTNDVNRIINQS